VLTERDFDLLPEDGVFEVVDGRAILMPGNDISHQEIVMTLYESIGDCLKRAGGGYVFAGVNVMIPPRETDPGEIRNRVPDLVVSIFRPEKRFRPGAPPELAIEVLSTPRGNVERTEKLDDYALAGIREYWVVNPFQLAIECYRLRGAEFAPPEVRIDGEVVSRSIPGVQLKLDEFWGTLR
jgi:Uma2 family endonuclease